MSKKRELNNYINWVKKEGVETLSLKEERILAQRIKKGDLEAKNKLFFANSRLVVLIAKKFQRKGIFLLDLIQEGNIGLLKAIEKFKPSKGFRFGTYACWWIRHYIQKYINNHSREITIPMKKEEMLRKIEDAFKKLKQENEGNASSSAVAEHLKKRRSQVDYIINISQPVLSLDYSADDENSKSTLNISDSKWNAEEIVMKNMMKTSLKKILEGLMDVERKIIMYRYGLYDGTRYTLKETSDIFRSSPETIRRIEMSVLEKIRKEHSTLKEYIQ